MYVELIYDKCNFDGLDGANGKILAELTKRINRIFPDAAVKVKPMAGNSSINTDANKVQKAKISEAIEEMFEEADMWLTEEF